MRWRHRGTFVVGVLVGLALGSALPPGALADERTDPGATVAEDDGYEPWATGWSFSIDNDFLSFGFSSDQGYTGGFALALSGRHAVEYPWSLDPVVGWFDHATGWDGLYRDAAHDTAHAWEIGTAAFTPDDTDTPEPLLDDYPYAGLVFVSNTRDARLRERRVRYLSSFTLGLLGTGVPETIQDAFHELADDDEARGWDNQISDGGEPTAMWKIQRQQTHWLDQSSGGIDYDIKSVVGGSIGYITQASAGVHWRLGSFDTPWWSFNPDYTEYISVDRPASRPGGSELFLWGGLQFRRHFYNAFLEGQFRDSAVTFDRGEDLDSTLREAGLGVTWRTRNGYHVTFALRARDRELRVGGDERPSWGSLIIGRDY